MIFLKKGQSLATNTGLVVYDPTGYYEDGDTVVCASVTAPDEPVCRYEAKYIAYGTNVYSISKEDELLQEVKKIDPKTLLGKNRAQAEAEKLLNEIIERDIPPPAQLTEQITAPATTTPATVEAPVSPVSSSTSTPTTSTTTPATSGIEEVIPPVTTEVPTSTTPIVSTSTDPIVDPITDPPVVPLEAPPAPKLEVVPELVAPEAFKATGEQASLRRAVKKVARGTTRRRS